MLVGLGLVGVAGYYLLALSGRTLPPADASAVAVLYLLANIIGPGLASALEQETSRAVSQELARGGSPDRAVRKMVRLGATVMAVACVLILLLGPILVRHILNGRWSLLLALLGSVVTFGSLYLVRGVLSGRQLFGGYAVTLVTEGLARLVPLGLLTVVHVASPGLYGLVFVAAGGFAALAGLPWLRQTAGAGRVGSSAEPSGLERSFGLLLASSLLMQAMANLAPVVASSRLHGDAALAAVLASGFVVARVPVFLFAPVQAMLLPRLVRSAAIGDVADVRRQVARVLGAVGCVGLLGVAAMWVSGRWVLENLFGGKAVLPLWVLPVLGIGTLLTMTIQVLQPALLASTQHARLLYAWAAGTICLIVIVVLPVTPVSAAVWGQLVGPLVVVLGAGGALLSTRGPMRAAPARTPALVSPQAGSGDTTDRRTFG